ncbi:MAG: type II toxin-antitoxin system RatA family toxin [Wenzhouxiangella sp.]
MPQIHRFALVAHPPKKMFDLVRQVRLYPEFLPWVRAAELHEEGDDRQVATLEVRIAGIVQRFTTENELVEAEQITMKLQKGPFEQLSGTWRFKPLGTDGARVSLDLSFSLPGSVLLGPFKRGFERMADRMVDDFCRRADDIHG